MSALALIRRRLRHLFRRERNETEMAEEMRFHLEQRAADYVEDGLGGDDARHAAQRKFGNVGRIQEQARDDRGWGWLDRWVKDVRLALRRLGSNPGFTVLAIVTLGLGIGANTSMFSVLNAMALTPLPYPNQEQLDRFYRDTAQRPDGGVFSAADFFDFERAKDGYGDVAAYILTYTSIAERGRAPDMVYAARATPNLFSMLGTRPELGRDFRPEEATVGRDRVVILNHRVWLSRYGGVPDVIGRTIRIDGEPHTIVGVMSQAFNDGRHLGVIDLYRPLALTPEQAANRTDLQFRVLGRRAAHLSREDAAAYVTSFSQRLARDFPKANAETTWRAKSLHLVTMGLGGLTVMPMVIGLSGAVLLMACSNLANLLLARTMVRAREFAVRAALGASRLQLLRPLLVESLLLALAGGVVAILVALWFHDWAAVRSTDDNGEHFIMALDWRVLAWTFGVALMTALAFGLAPALFALRLNVNHTLKSGGRNATSGMGHQRFRQVLVVVQFALAMVLLTGAGIFLRGLHELNNRRAGWSSEQLVTGSLYLPAATYSDAERIHAFNRRVLERLEALPGVASVSLSAFTPFLNWPEARRFVVEGRERPQPGREPVAVMNPISPRYFDTYGTRLAAGRAFTTRDHAKAPRVFIVSQATARALFGQDNPLGQRIAYASAEAPEWGEVVGVANDVQPSTAERNPVTFQIYQPLAQAPRQGLELAVRMSSAAPSTVVPQIRAAIAELDPELPVRRLQPADITIDRSNYTLGVLRDILLTMALLGLGLAALGIYGVVSRTMAQRMPEFAIRLALGASMGGLTRLVLGTGLKLAIVGSVCGVAGAIGVAQILAYAFPGMHTGGVAMAAICTTVMLMAVALFACWMPARRAARVDAMQALRAE